MPVPVPVPVPVPADIVSHAARPCRLRMLFTMLSSCVPCCSVLLLWSCAHDAATLDNPRVAVASL
jgi:hypothetical protein